MNLRNEYSPYFAPEANTAICVNGQLFLAMLIEEVQEIGAKVLLSNTDGICIRFREDLTPKIMDACKEWEKTAKLKLEYVYYDKIIFTAVNDYLAIKTPSEYDKFALKEADFPTPEEYMEYNFAIVKNTYKGNNINDLIKTKGMYIPYPRVGKGLDSLIVSKALINYFAKGIPVETTVKDFRSIHDYLIYKKVKKEFKVEYNGVEQQHINRYFVASKANPSLFRVKIEKGVKKYANLLKGEGVILANDLTKNEDYKDRVDYQYYIRRANKLIAAIERKQMTLFD